MAVAGEAGRVVGLGDPVLLGFGGERVILPSGSDSCTINKLHVFFLKVGKFLEERGASRARRGAAPPPS